MSVLMRTRCKKKPGMQKRAQVTPTSKKKLVEEAAERKRIKNVEARIRPEDKEYFIPAQTFQGWKLDYIFTTYPDRGTGYFWDGMDSIKQLRGELPEEKETWESRGKKREGDDDVPEANGENQKPKKKHRKKKAGPVIVSDPTNPLEQVAAVLERRNQMASAGGALSEGWEATQDHGTGKTYYFNRSTGERSWTKPVAPEEKVAQDTDNDETLPEGWSVAVDRASGKSYYYHANGQTRWDEPTSS